MKSSAVAEPIRIGIFGTGFARHVILPCLRHVDGVHLAGICSHRLERAEAAAAEFGIEHAALHHRAVLERARPELVFIATPPHRHAEMAIDALQTGCHVVCEKPTALTARQSRAMLAAALRRPEKLALIDHELRFDPGRLALRDQIASGRLGVICHLRYTLDSPARRDREAPWSWWSDRAQGGGALGAIGSHAVDSLRCLLADEVAEVRGFLHTFIAERVDPGTGRNRAVSADDLAAAWLRFRSGAIASVSISTVEGRRLHRITVAGTDACASLDEQGPLRIAVGRDSWAAVPVPDGLPSSEELGIPNTDWARSFLRMARRVVEAIRSGQASVPGAATFEDGHRTQLVLDAIRRSADEAAWVRIVEEAP